MKTRLLAILLTDLSGFTEFSARTDRRGLTAAVRQQQRIITPIIKEFHGRLVKWIGDAALAVFGSAMDAMLCGRRIQLAFVDRADRGQGVITPRIKVVVNAGDVMVDADGDIYGEAVNFTARLEKAANVDEVYFSEAVRLMLPGGEIPHERVGEFEFKGIPGRVWVYRTCYGQTPIVRERVALLQTNFVGVQGLADEFGWEAVHPVLDEMTGTIAEATRAQGGTSWGALQVGSFLTFARLMPALHAVRAWTATSAQIECGQLTRRLPKVRSALHWGTLHVMKHTIMGRDIDLVRTLAALGAGEEVLLTADAVRVAEDEGMPRAWFRTIDPAKLRDCGSRTRWVGKFQAPPVYAIDLADLAQRDLA